TKSWEVTPIFFNDISLPYKHPDFESRLQTNDFLKNSYRETFIEGENNAWTFSNAQKARWYDDYSYVRLGIEEAGALMSGIDAIRPGIVGPYSQYVKLDYDLRHFIVQRHSTTALRLYGGVGIPYGPNSVTLPYLKQYFVGGPFSMRGWRIRTLGPGSYIDTSKLGESNTSSFIDLTGDIKIEMNGEYRFEIFKLFGGVLVFKGALFADAGNIWLARKSASYPWAEFRVSRLYRDLAVDGGFGIRMDIASLFVLRADVAMPLKTPENPDYQSILNQGWLPNGFEPLNGHWRSDNLVLNIAIGYPF
ncbi:MAG: outer membrane protein assembly factor, partial [Taibaiella sp.]|nr:outer membrane protein assembly factor [Taibaiella sp.]